MLLNELGLAYGRIGKQLREEDDDRYRYYFNTARACFERSLAANPSYRPAQINQAALDRIVRQVNIDH